MQKKTIALIAGSFHKKEVEMMVAEATKTAKEHDLHIGKVLWVPGSLEKPLALDRVLADPAIDGAVVVGIIERGQTKHGLVMGIAVTQAIIQLQLTYKKPVGMGILGPEILPDQIAPRLLPYAADAVKAVSSMLTLG